MCGIVGISGRQPIDPDALAAAVEALAHRGPDGSGAFLDETGQIGLGHTRLSIIDLSDAGAQPMTSRDGRYTITFNGEIYNYRELRAELVSKGVRFIGQSDTEVLLEGYARLGPEILGKVNGIFAFAIHDAEQGELFLARDPLGVKPLYYAETPEGFIFSSEIKALLRLARVDRGIDGDALLRYLTFLWCPGEQTLLRAVKKLEPGMAMRVRKGATVRRWSYWSWPPYTPRRDWSWRDCAEELRNVLDRCVRRQMVADVPVGAFLSGGLDSSAVVAAATRAAPNIQCFTIDTPNEQGAPSDLPYARKAAEALGVKLHEVRVDAKRMAARLADLPRMLDEPLADPAALNVLFIAELARSMDIKVLQSGAGGDDLFTGYRRHTAMAHDGLWDLAPTALRAGAARLAEPLSGRGSGGRRLKKLLSGVVGGPEDRLLHRFAWARGGLPKALLAPELRAALSTDDAFAPMRRHLRSLAPAPAVEKCLALEQRFFLADHNLNYTDKMTMAVGVEARVPLIDLELVDFAARVPVEWKHRGLTPKWLFKQSQVGRLPQEVIFRPKTGFGAPLRNWLHGDLRELVRDLLSEASIRRRGLFDADAVARLLQADEAGRTDGTYSLFAMVCTELWCRAYAEAPASAPSSAASRLSVRSGAGAKA